MFNAKADLVDKITNFKTSTGRDVKAQFLCFAYNEIIETTRSTASFYTRSSNFQGEEDRQTRV
jgi:hypothetical protein